MYGVAVWSRKAAFLVAGLLITILLLTGYRYRRWQPTDEPWALDISQHQEVEPVDSHPISELIYKADQDANIQNGNLSASYSDVVSRYRERYGRHPPPHFRHWYKFARTKNVLDLNAFDQIHQDLRPFWAIRPAVIRYRAAHSADNRGDGLIVLSIRDGQFIAPREGRHVEAVMKMIKGFVQWLPDMDIPVNRMRTPRILASYEDVQGWHKVEELSRGLLPRSLLQQNFTQGMRGLRNINPMAWSRHPLKSPWSPFWFPSEHGEDPIDLPPIYPWKEYVARFFWQIATRGCPQDAPLRKIAASESTGLRKRQAESEGIFTDTSKPADICSFTPETAVLHGTLASPSEMKVISVLFPVFSEAKMSFNGDILVPSSDAYLGDDGILNRDSDDIQWKEKIDRLFWRGDTSGGWSFDENDPKDPRSGWLGWQKQRLVRITNASEAEQPTSIDSLLHGSEDYTPSSLVPADFAAEHVDTGFTAYRDCKKAKCDFYGGVFSLVPPVSLRDWWKNKFVLDLDGTGGSSLFRTLLHSRSLPIKSTIFQEWHTSRLIPWHHYIPLSHTYTELWSVLTYLIGYQSSETQVPGHDAEARRLAEQGRQWVGRVLRKQDMEVYMFRLLLEYGRLIDDRRERLGELLDDEDAVG